MKLFSAVCRLIISLSAGVTAAPARDNRSEAHIYATGSPGGPHGTPFDDKAFPTTNHKRIAYVTLHGCAPGDHVSMIEIGYRDNHNPSTIIKDIVFHGGHAEKTPVTLKLERDEWFTQIRTTTWEHKITNPITWHTRTRIGNIEMFTNLGHSISCGAYSQSDPGVIDKPKFNDGALIYFSGRSGDAIDMIQAHWIPTVEF